jgi:hypothetical protein
MDVGLILGEIAHAALITSLVFVMMAVVELLAVGTQGRLTSFMGTSRWRQYGLAALLGAIPGCAGAYLAVSMFSHASLSLGAVTAALIATSGDEAFVMLATMPVQALGLFLGLFVFAMLAGSLTDFTLRRFGVERTDPCALTELHEEDLTGPSPVSRWLPLRLRWHPTIPRVVLLTVLLALVVGLISGVFEHGEHSGHGGHTLDHDDGMDLEAWIFLVVAVLGMVMVATAPEHDLVDHLWHHLAKHHAPRIFAWTASTLVAVSLLDQHFHLDALVEGRGLFLLLGASLLGLIPQSGPHLIVVTLFLSGQIPASILVANSVVQDGHALLPLLGISPRDAVLAKAANFIFGLLLGGVLLIAGL